MTHSPSWFAVQVRAQHEKSIAQMLSDRGYDQFLPLKMVSRSKAHRPKDQYSALFPGYLFCRINLAERQASVITTPGVIRLVGIGCNPTAVPDEEISSLRTVIRSTVRFEAASIFKPGFKVRIADGPLRGVEGRLVSIRGKDRLLVAVSLLQRAISLEIDQALVTPLNEQDPYPPLRQMAMNGQITEFSADTSSPTALAAHSASAAEGWTLPFSGSAATG